MREKIIAANWKMNLNRDQAIDLVMGINNVETEAKIIICPPFTLLESVRNAIELAYIPMELGAQNMHYEESGAFTGEIAPKMLRDWDVKYVILGHSERRKYYNETDEIVNKKVITAFRREFIPIVCVGEDLETRVAGNEIEFVKAQVAAALNEVHKEELDSVIFAYEPIWAIGTGKTATPQQADQMIAEIRKQIDKSGGNGQNNTILYGGSMNEKNAKELMAMENIDGGLIGSASLLAEKFVKLLNYKK